MIHFDFDNYLTPQKELYLFKMESGDSNSNSKFINKVELNKRIEDNGIFEFKAPLEPPINKSNFIIDNSIFDLSNKLFDQQTAFVHSIRNNVRPLANMQTNINNVRSNISVKLLFFQDDVEQYQFEIPLEDDKKSGVLFNEVRKQNLLNLNNNNGEVLPQNLNANYVNQEFFDIIFIKNKITYDFLRKKYLPFIEFYQELDKFIQEPKDLTASYDIKVLLNFVGSQWQKFTHLFNKIKESNRFYEYVQNCNIMKFKSVIEPNSESSLNSETMTKSQSYSNSETNLLLEIFNSKVI